MTKNISSKTAMAEIQKILTAYLRLPFSDVNVPGSVMEHVIAHVYKGERLNTYDYVDVIDRENGIGWSIKSTLEDTPLTWKRVKIANKYDLINQSYGNKKGIQKLGDAIIDCCNEHAAESIRRYSLTKIVYSRLIICPEGHLKYFERPLCTADDPKIFNKRDFYWEWSEQKEGKKKEQLPALQGIDVKSGVKWWAWHGRGENQLHFSGENAWWPKRGAMTFQLPPNSKLTFEQLDKLLRDV